MSATFVGVMGKDPSPCCGRDPPGVVRSKLRQQLGDLFPVGGDQHFAAGFQKLLDAIPRVGDQASAGANAEAKKALWSAVPTWPVQRTFAGTSLSCQPAPPSKKL